MPVVEPRAVASGRPQRSHASVEEELDLDEQAPSIV
jgi:hypothetical protein